MLKELHVIINEKSSLFAEKIVSLYQKSTLPQVLLRSPPTAEVTKATAAASAAAPVVTP